MDGVDRHNATKCDEMRFSQRQNATGCETDELDIPLNTLEGQIMLGARDLIAEEAFTEVSECQS